MFVVLYRWRIKPEFEDQFIQAWSKVTEYYVQNFDSLGSRLPQGDDRIFYAYAQWHSAEQRERAFLRTELTLYREQMSEAIEERLPETSLEIVSDLLQ